MNAKRLPGAGKGSSENPLARALFHQFAGKEDNPVLVLNAAGKILYSNPAFSRVAHQPIRNLTGKAFKECWPGNDAGRLERSLSQAWKERRTLTLSLKRDETAFRFRITPEGGRTSSSRFFLVMGKKSGAGATKRKPSGRRLPQVPGPNAVPGGHFVQSILDNAPFGAHAYTLEADRRLVFLGGNHAADRILSIDHSALVSKTIEEAFPGLAGTPIPDIYRTVAADGEEYAADQVQYENGQIKGAFEIHAFKTGRRSMAVFFRDITERKKIEDELRISQMCIDNASIGIFRIDSEGRINAVNHHACTCLGYSRAELEQLTVFDIDPTFTKERWKEHRTSLYEGRTRTIEAFHRRKDGSLLPVEVTDNHLSVADRQWTLSFVRDITDRKAAEEALQENEEKFRIAFENAPTGMSIIRSDGHYIAVNPLLCEMFGYSREDLLSGTIYTITHPDDVERSNAWIRKVISGDLSEPEFEKRYIHKDGHIVWGLVRAQWIRNADGTPRMSIVHILDITKRKSDLEALHASGARARALNEELEERVRERTVQLETANKELESFSYSVSHDLRAPLRAIDGYTRILIEDHGSELADDAKRACSVVRSETQRMGRLIDDLLSFSRLNRSQMRDSFISTAGMVDDVLVELLPPEDRQRVTVDVSPLPGVHADPALLRQVWVNLLSNAVKFSSKRTDPRIIISATTTASEVVFSVRDNGAGFDMQYADKLFGVFQRLHSIREFEGTGVGLAIVQRIVHRHGGRVWAEGEPNKGATFFFTLPRKSE
jgi:PAS domain S-box-containing protein